MRLRVPGPFRSDSRLSWGRFVGGAAMALAATAALPLLIHTGSLLALGFIVTQAIGAYCIMRRSVTHQVLGQGIAAALALSHVGVWLVALRRPMLFTTTSSLLALAGVIALVCALPFWSSQKAQERFAPLVSRNAFLFGAIGSVAVAERVLHGALVDAVRGGAYYALTGVALTVMLLAQATAVVRMRGWGVLLATATGAACVVPAWVLSGADARLSVLATLTSALLVLPVLWGRRTPRAPRREAARIRLDVAAIEAQAALEAQLDAPEAAHEPRRQFLTIS